MLGDDSSATDRLVVNGATSGSTHVNVLNRGGLGAQTVEGVKIIDVAGASNGTFALTAHYGKADSSVRSIFGNGLIETQGYGLGATLTWYGPKGFYVDG